MAPTHKTYVVDEINKTVTIRQEHYVLSEGTFVAGYHHVVQATQVDVKTGFRNPGCDLDLYAARVVVDAGGGHIDVSGAAGVDAPTGRPDATGYQPDTRNGGNGGKGGDGKPGQAAGHVSIFAGRIEGGTLTVKARGGVGGRAQDGGNGKDGKQPPERSKAAVPQMHQTGMRVIDEKHRAPVYEWDWDVTWIGRLKAAEAYLLVANQTSEGIGGGNGGHAGLAGAPGAGGSGGNVSIHSVVPCKTPVNATELAGGDAGATATHGHPGKGGEGGLGAKYLYKADAGMVPIGWSAYDEDDKWNQHWNSCNSKAFWISVDHFANLGVDNNYIVYDGSCKKLKLRAAPGQAGTAGGYGDQGARNAPAIPVADRGADGRFETATAGEGHAPRREAPLAYLLMLERSATAAIVNRDRELAADILRWLMVLTARFKQAGGDASGEPVKRRTIYYASEQRLLALGNDDAQGAPALRCVYKDIGLYSGFVETLLGHVSRQEQYVATFAEEARSLDEKREAVTKAIDAADQYIVHLTGSVLEPGTITYALEREKQLKTAIGELDVQVLDYQDVLERMPQTLQQEIDAEIRKKTELNVWTMLELIGMAAGIAINFASAAGSLKEMVSKVGAFYKESLELSTFGDILKEGIWSREFTQIKEDLSALLETDEWKNLSRDAKAFIGKTSDFHAKIDAYDAIAKSRKEVGFALDRIDVQASVLVFDTAKLDLKKQRNEFEHYIRTFLDDYEQAREWKHVFTDYFDTAETRFDLLAHLAEIQAERRRLEYEREQARKNIEVLRTQLGKLSFDPEAGVLGDIAGSLEANLNLAYEAALNRITDEGRAYAIWTLGQHAFPPVRGNLKAEFLRASLHEPLWEKIQNLLSSGSLPASKDFSSSPMVWRREEYPKQFERFAETGKITLTLSPDPASNIYFERIIDARVYLRGATVEQGSEVHCILRHSGVSEFLDRQRNVVVCYQEPRGIEFSYIEKEGDVPGPDYDYEGAIRNRFDTDTGISRIRYSPYTSWELRVVPDYRQTTGGRVYNQNIDLSALEAIELRLNLFYSSYLVNAKAKPAAMPGMAESSRDGAFSL